MRVLATDWARVPIGIKRGAEFEPAYAGAICDEVFPFLRPAEIAHQLARQAERKIEAADPRPRPRKESLEFRECLELFNRLDGERLAARLASGNRNRLPAAGRAGEVDAVDPHFSSSRNASSAAERWPRRHTSIVRAFATLGGRG